MNFGPSLEGKNKGFKYTETLCRRYPSFTLKKLKVYMKCIRILSIYKMPKEI